MYDNYTFPGRVGRAPRVAGGMGINENPKLWLSLVFLKLNYIDLYIASTI